MPTVPIDGIFPDDMLHLRAIMLWPGVEHANRRQQSFAIDLAGGLVDDRDSSASIQCDAGLIKALLDAPGREEHAREVRQRTKRAFVAGYVLLYMLLMDQFKDDLPPRGAPGASLKKAYFLSSEWARQGGKFGDGDAMPVATERVKRCWREYRPVAHLWASFAANTINLIDYAPKGRALSKDHLPAMLRVAAQIQEFAVRFPLDDRARRGPSTLLSLTESWLVDSQNSPPAPTFSFPATMLAESAFMTILRDYEG